jgi:predicted alpha-1,6-mannanase (GH76 family)
MALLFMAGMFVLVGAVRAQEATPEANYAMYAGESVVGLQAHYNPANGLWDTTGWWNSANALTTLVEYMLYSRTQDYLDVVQNTYKMNMSKRFLNNFYDDEGWWALAWVRAYDLTGEQKYLALAQTIFADMTTGWDDTCGGGLWWSKDRNYKNAIPNELFLQLAARLHNRIPDDTQYLDWAQKEWAWFQKSGLINADNLINDGLKDCQNNQDITWTYNQGVILGGLVELYKATQDEALLKQARAIADAAITSPALTENGILREPCELSYNCGADGPQFKGVFMRNLLYLYQQTGEDTYRDFLLRNADSIWLRNRKNGNQFGLRWTGKFDRNDAARQSSALDALNAAMAAS